MYAMGDPAAHCSLSLSRTFHRTADFADRATRVAPMVFYGTRRRMNQEANASLWSVSHYDFRSVNRPREKLTNR